jgi:hypothetical protein
MKGKNGGFGAASSLQRPFNAPFPPQNQQLQSSSFLQSGQGGPLSLLSKMKTGAFRMGKAIQGYSKGSALNFSFLDIKTETQQVSALQEI